MAKGKVIPDAEYIALMDKGLTDREIAERLHREPYSTARRLNRIRRDIKAAQRLQKQRESLIIYTMPPEEIKALYGERGEYATTPEVAIDMSGSTRMQRLRGGTY